MFKLDMAKDEGEPVEAGTKIRIAKLGCADAREVLSMRAKYFRDNIDFGVEQARQMANLVEGYHEINHYSSYHTVRTDMKKSIEHKADKEISRVRFGTGTKKDGARDAIQSDN